MQNDTLFVGDVAPVRDYSVGEEIAHSVTHGLGALFGVVAMTLLVVYAVQGGPTPARLASAIVFGISMVTLYTFSTLYHSFPWPRVKRVFKVLDHAGIYLLIAGSYTPFCLITLRDSGGLTMFAVIWALAVAGISAEAFWNNRPKWLSALVYIGMGWLVVFTIEPLMANLDRAGVWLLVAGGLAYTLGTVFYVPKRIPYLHMIWHLFVLAGSVLHFLAVALYVIG